MKNLTKYLWLAASLLVLAHPAWANPGVEMRVVCPADAMAGTTLTVDLDLVNLQCLQNNVRVMSSITGNANDSLGGIGIFGPVVAMTIPLAAATSNDPPGICTFGYCSGDFTSCTTDADCACQYGAITTVTSFADIPLTPAIPSSLVGTVATFILVAEANDGVSDALEVTQCLVNVIP